MQKQDPRIQEAMSWTLEETPDQPPSTSDPYLEGLWKRRKQLTVHDGILYRKDATKDPSASKLLVVIPQDFIPQILHHLHGSPIMGHTSSHTAQKIASSSCYWPNMSSDIHNYIAPYVIHVNCMHPLFLPLRHLFCQFRNPAINILP